MKKKIFSDVRVLVLIFAVATTSIFYLTIISYGDNADYSTYDGVPKAAIIDQLYSDWPNPQFQQDAKEFLESAGYQVDIFTTESVTVDFYKKLPTMNYQFVVVRTHGASEKSGDKSITLFTGERYTEEKYIQEQLFGHVKKATPLLERFYQSSPNKPSDWVQVNDTYRYLKTPANTVDETKDAYFALSPKFVKESMVGKFADTIFLLGGCNTLENPTLAKSLINRGASAVVGWDDVVGAGNNDGILLGLLHETLVNNLELEEAVDTLMKRYDEYNQIRMYKPYEATLKYYSEKNI